ncbi:MAG: type 4a pilus biogenesis protein PilO [Deltaproteobacteria bacterium]|nr:type 4a pilus biogenesis protein PilO [Deltaproteobacteria bacterium]
MSELWSRLLAVWDNLSPRERVLIGAAGGMLVVTILFVGLVQPILTFAGGAGTRVESAEQQLGSMIRLRRDYDEVNGRLSKVEERIRGNRDDRNLLTLLETLAKESSVKVDSMEERKSPDDEKYKETRVEVELKKVTLTDTVSYLHKIEASDRLLTVKSLRVKGRSDKSDMLDVSFNVSTFEPL